MVHVPTDIMALNPKEASYRVEARSNAIESALISLGWLLKEDERMCVGLQQLVNDAVEALREIDDDMLECEEE